MRVLLPDGWQNNQVRRRSCANYERLVALGCSVLGRTKREESKALKRGIRFLGLLAGLMLIQPVSAASTNTRLSNDDPAAGGYVSNYTMNTGVPYTDNTLTECSRSRGRQNEPAVAVD